MSSPVAASVAKDSKVVDAVKPIPSESADAIRSKTLVILNFWAVVFFLGLPIWWWTTSIHRASLPTQSMLAWSDGKACQLNIPLQIELYSSDWKDSTANSLANNVETALAARASSGIEQIHLNRVSSLDGQKTGKDKEVALTVVLKDSPGLNQPTAELVRQSTILEVFYDSSLLKRNQETYTKTITDTLVEKVQGLFTEEQSSISQLLASAPGHESQQSASAFDQSNTVSSEMTTKMAAKRTRSVKYAPTYHISISLFTPEAIPTSWEIEDAVSEYLRPLLNSFSISNFTVDTQLQLYAPFSPAIKAPEFDWATQQWQLREEDLGSFINAAEWPLSPHIGDGPTLNFILYVPQESLRPLVIKDSGANSWIIPQWGGISILNSDGPISASLSKEQLRPAVLTIAHQLLSLLGAPETPSSFPLQIQSLTRFHALSLMLSASSTLGSLARLSESLATIPIPEEVLLRVQRGLEHLDQACMNLKSGKARQALEHARIAEAEAEKAFFEKDMVSQVYFPDEHKVAVYLPLLGPVGVTLLTSTFREVKRRRAAAKRI